MNLLSPTSLFLFTLALPIIALYILKLRRRREWVPTLMFWEQIFRERQTTSLFQKLRRWLSLLLQLAFLALLTLALTQPQFAFMTGSARQIVLIVDNSASMNTVDAGETRLALAKEKTRRIIDQIRYMDAMMVMSCHRQLIIHTPFTNHQKTLRQAVEEIPNTDIRTDMKPALELAYSVAGTKPNAEVILVSDYQHVPDDVLALFQSPPEGVTLHLWSVGSTESNNVGITRFRVRKSMANAFDYQTLLELTNASDEERQFNVELYLDDQLFDVRPYTLIAGESRTEIFNSFSFEGGKFKAVLDVADALPTDNVAYAVLPRREKLSVLLVTPGNPFLESALRVDEKLDLTVVSPDQYAPVGSAYAVTLLDRYWPTELPNGNVILIYPPIGDTPWSIGEELVAPIITDWERKHPILRYVHLDNVQIAAAYAITPPSEAEILVRSFEDPLVFLYDTPERRIVFFAMDTLQSDLPLRVAFPVILANSIQWFQRQVEVTEHALNTGEILSPMMLPQEQPVAANVSSDPSATATIATIAGPTGQRWELEPQDGRILFEHTDQAGFYDLKSADYTESWAVNLTDTSESALQLSENVTPLLDEDIVWGTSALLRYPPWIYLVFLALALSAVEWYLYQRRKVE